MRSAALCHKFVSQQIGASRKNVVRHFNSALHLTPEELKHYPATDVTTLSNGIRVATEKSPINNSTATVGVWIDAGSRYETKENNGAAHFLEHLAFKGTNKRTQNQLEMEVENMGGHLNAYTSREQTVYYAQTPKESTAQAVDILADIIQDSKLTPDNIERERSVILREMEEVYKETEEYVFDYLHDAAFMNNQLGQTILGPKENIERINQDDLKKYISDFYTGDRMVVCGAGAVDHAELVQLAQEKFGDIPAQPKKKVIVPPAIFTGSDYRERQDDYDMLHVAFGFPTCGWTDPATYGLLYIHALLGSWEENRFGGEHSYSRLVRHVSSQRLCDKFMTFNTLYKDTGLFGVYFSAYEKRSRETMQTVAHAMTSLCVDVDDKMVETARNQIVSNTLAALDTSSQTCEDIGRQMLTLGRRQHPAEIVARINAVDKSFIKATAKRFFWDQDHALASVGPSWELPDYTYIRQRSYFLTR